MAYFLLDVFHIDIFICSREASVMIFFTLLKLTLQPVLQSSEQLEMYEIQCKFYISNGMHS